MGFRALPLPSSQYLTVKPGIRVRMRSDPQDVNTVGAHKGLPKDSVAVSVRRAILFLLAMSVAYFFIWVPWRSSRANFLLFLGFGMIQIAAVYTQDLRESLKAGDAQTLYVWLLRSPLFMNPFMSLLVTALALLGFATELIIGGRSKAWWEALLLPLPPIVLASYTFPRTNPVRPFFVGVGALILALVLKIM